MIDQRKQTHEYSISVSMVEIYNETIRDLLVGKKGESWPGGEINEIETANEEARKKADTHAKADRRRGMSKERFSRKHGNGAPTSAAGSNGARYGAGGGLAITRGENGNELLAQRIFLCPVQEILSILCTVGSAIALLVARP